MTAPKNATAADGSILETDVSIGEKHAASRPDFLRVVRVRRKIILGTAVASVALVTAIMLQLTPLYSATAVVLLDQSRHILDEKSDLFSDRSLDQAAAVQNQIQVLTSLSLADKVVTKLGLTKDPEFSPMNNKARFILININLLRWLPASLQTQAKPQSIDPERAEIVHRFLDRERITPVGLSAAMRVSFDSRDPEKAARIANAIADTYVEDQLEAKFLANRKATAWLTARIDELSRQTQAADSAVQQYKVEHNITTTTTGGSVVEQQIGNVNQQLVAAKAELADKQANYDRLSALARSGQAANAASVLSSPLIAQLRAQETQLTNQIALMSTKYLPRHPKILDLEAQKANLDAQIAVEVQRIVDATKNEVSVAYSHVQSLQQSLREAERLGAGQNQAQVQLSSLEAAAASAREMYQAMLGQLNQTEGREGIQMADAQVISRAEVPQTPSYPKKMLGIGVSIPAGLLLGLILAFAIERLHSGFRTASEVERLLGLPVLSTIPESEGIGKAWSRVADTIIDKPLSFFSEAMRGVELGLALSNPDAPPQVIVVTSSVPAEGKTTVASSLARLGARGGRKTVIIDADLRRPAVAKTLGLKRPETGLVELLADQRLLERCLHKDPKSGAWVLPCARPAASPLDLLSSGSFYRLVSYLRSVFDVIIIDTPPLVPVNDTKILVHMADAVLLVVRWRKTPPEVVVDALKSLTSVRARVAGVALTRADYERFRYYSYGYHDTYSHYYHN